MRRAGFVIVALLLVAVVVAGCSSASKPNAAAPATTVAPSVVGAAPTTSTPTNPPSGTPTTAGTKLTGLAFVQQWCPQVESDYQKILTAAGAAHAAPPNVADVVLADELFVGGPFASLKATVDNTDVADRPLKAVAEIGVAADWCKSNGY